MKTKIQNVPPRRLRYARNVVLHAYLAATKDPAFRAFVRQQLGPIR